MERFTATELTPLIQQVCAAVNASIPPGFSCSRVAGGIEVMHEGKSFGINGFDAVVVQDRGSREENIPLAMTALLNFIQNCVMETTAEPWPTLLGNGLESKEVGSPRALLRDHTLYSGYVLDDTWLLQMEPIRSME